MLMLSYNRNFLPVKNRKVLKRKNKKSNEERVIEKNLRKRKFRCNEYYKNIVDHLYNIKYLNVPKKTEKMINYFKECNSAIDTINHIRQCFLRHRHKHFSTKFLLRENYVIPNRDIIVDTYNILKKEKMLKEGKEIVKEKYNKIEKKILRVLNGADVEASIYNCFNIEDIYY
ncbi:hypothetical protein SteCoe_17697 [Stentor coeruleus]|uniref:Uncharacterized protein n=1 Tax=Stentor coeruleus TaxID=5963 RepID=A0A1R2BY82_9CILI|nr:hypothetical protein SteCoe_17697 [Stentor coeruleus]